MLYLIDEFTHECLAIRVDPVWTALHWQGFLSASTTLVGAAMCPTSHDDSSVNSFSADAIRGELSFPQGIPANLTSGGITIPATVPHSGRESFEGTTPLCEDGARRHAGHRRRSLGSRDCNAVAVLSGSADGQTEGFITAPSGITPSMTNRHRAISSLRARATTITLRRRRPVEPTRSRNQATCAAPGW